MPEPREISATGQLTVSDLYGFSVRYLFMKLWWFALIMAMVAIFGAVSLIQGAPIELNIQTLLGFSFPFVLAPYFFLIAPYFGAKKRLRTVPNFSGQITYLFSDSGIDISAIHSNSQSTWTGIVEVKETSGQLWIFPQSSMAFVIPKRFFTDPLELPALRDLIRANVKNSKLKNN